MAAACQERYLLHKEKPDRHHRYPWPDPQKHFYDPLHICSICYVHIADNHHGIGHEKHCTAWIVAGFMLWLQRIYPPGLMSVRIVDLLTRRGNDKWGVPGNSKFLLRLSPKPTSADKTIAAFLIPISNSADRSTTTES